MGKNYGHGNKSWWGKTYPPSPKNKQTNKKTILLTSLESPKAQAESSLLFLRRLVFFSET